MGQNKTNKKSPNGFILAIVGSGVRVFGSYFTLQRIKKERNELSSLQIKKIRLSVENYFDISHIPNPLQHNLKPRKEFQQQRPKPFFFDASLSSSSKTRQPVSCSETQFLVFDLIPKVVIFGPLHGLRFCSQGAFSNPIESNTAPVARGVVKFEFFEQNQVCRASLCVVGVGAFFYILEELQMFAVHYAI